jgi:hypothetical protein
LSIKILTIKQMIEIKKISSELEFNTELNDCPII